MGTLGILWLGAAGALASQRLVPGYVRGDLVLAGVDTTGRRAAPMADPAGMALAGLAGGAAGMVAGAYIGSALGGGSRICGDDPCGFEEAIYGAIAGIS